MKCEIERMEINYTFYFFAFLKKVLANITGMLYNLFLQVAKLQYR